MQNPRKLAPDPLLSFRLPSLRHPAPTSAPLPAPFRPPPDSAQLTSRACTMADEDTETRPSQPAMAIDGPPSVHDRVAIMYHSISNRDSCGRRSPQHRASMSTKGIDGANTAPISTPRSPLPHQPSKRAVSDIQDKAAHTLWTATATAADTVTLLHAQAPLSTMEHERQHQHPLTSASGKFRKDSISVTQRCLLSFSGLQRRRRRWPSLTTHRCARNGVSTDVLVTAPTRRQLQSPAQLCHTNLAWMQHQSPSDANRITYCRSLDCNGDGCGHHRSRHKVQGNQRRQHGADINIPLTFTTPTFEKCDIGQPGRDGAYPAIETLRQRVCGSVDGQRIPCAADLSLNPPQIRLFGAKTAARTRSGRVQRASAPRGHRKATSVKLRRTQREQGASADIATQRRRRRVQVPAHPYVAERTPASIFVLTYQQHL
ncbi:hypothetical protein BJ912DRAFT_1132257 [Pholiota molesta]|nr:hypothetical protein BJ912DRAFT_1132257 [Pholiota molesta]